MDTLSVFLMLLALVIAGIGAYAILSPTFREDCTYMKAYLTLGLKLALYKVRRVTMVDTIELRAKQYPDKVFIKYLDESLTYREMNCKMNKMAHAAMDLGLRPGDNAALLAFNSPLFVWTAYGQSISLHAKLLKTVINAKNN